MSDDWAMKILQDDLKEALAEIDRLRAENAMAVRNDRLQELVEENERLQFKNETLQQLYADDTAALREKLEKAREWFSFIEQLTEENKRLREWVLRYHYETDYPLMRDQVREYVKATKEMTDAQR